MAGGVTAPPVPTASPGTSGWRQRAAQFFCLLMLLGFPIFSVPCQKGSCASPLEVVMTYVYVKNLVPDEWVKAVLYPATMMLNMEVLMGDEPQSFQLPSWDSVLSTWNLTSSLVKDEKHSSQFSFSFIPNLLSMFDSQNPTSLSWGFVGACVVCLIGGLLSIFGPNKISFWGILLVLWFIFVEGGKRADVAAQPMFALAIICSLGWVNFKELLTFPVEDKPDAAEVTSEVDPKKKE